jgi:hypothetical protein
MPTGGDIKNVSVQHRSLGTRKLFCKAAEGSSYDLGGPRTKADKNAVDGSGAMIRTMNNTLASFKAKVAWDMSDREDLEFLTDLSASPDLANYTFTNINGISYTLTNGCPVGDIVGDGNDCIIDIEFQGESLQII